MSEPFVCCQCGEPCGPPCILIFRRVYCGDDCLSWDEEYDDWLARLQEKVE